MDDWVTIRSDALTARINPFGAELSSLADAAGRELMTNADPAYWTGRAPLLFPIVGALRHDTYTVDGIAYRMAKHGLARKSPFELIESSDASALFRLTDTDESRAIYPFAFVLDMAFALDGGRLTMTATLTNSGERDLPASFGYHPAFAWPLPYGEPREAHHIVFDRDEPAAIKALDGAGLIAGERESPLAGRKLRLADELFADDALIWVPVESRGLSYGAETGPKLDITWNAPMLGIWTKPGAAFVCVEPWWGHADPANAGGDIWDKPGIMRLAPGEAREFTISVTLTE